MTSSTDSLKYRFIGMLLAVVALLVPGSAPGASAGEDIAVLQAFYRNRMPGTKQLRESYANVTYTPLDRKELAFSLGIPKNHWRDIPAALSSEMLDQDNQRMISLAKHMAPENEKGEAKVEVVYMRMDLEIDLHDFVDLFLENYRTLFKVLARRDGRYNNRPVEEVLLHGEQDARPYMIRATFYRHGDLFFGILASSLASDFVRYAEPFTVAAVTFRMHRKAPHPYVEKMTAFTTKATPRLTIKHPGNWTVKEVPGAAGIAAVDLGLALPADNTQEMTQLGYIHARAVAKALNRTPEQILNELKKEFEKMGISFGARTLGVDLDPNLQAPLGKLVRWGVTINGVDNEAAFLLFPAGSACVAMGLISTPPERNPLARMHAWRVFELVAGDLTRRSVRLTKLKNHTLPPQQRLTALAADTMDAFAESVKRGNFDAFYAAASNHLKVQTTSPKLLQAFRGYSKVGELDQLKRLPPVLEKGIYLDREGLLRLDGYCPTQPEKTTFALTYIYEQTAWKLIGINVSMK